MSPRDRRSLKNITPQASGRCLALPRPGTGRFKAISSPSARRPRAPSSHPGNRFSEPLKEECKVVNILQTRATYYSKNPGDQGLQTVNHRKKNLRQVTVVHFHLLFRPIDAVSSLTPLSPPHDPACPASVASSAPSLTWCCPEQSTWKDLSRQ